MDKVGEMWIQHSGCLHDTEISAEKSASRMGGYIVVHVHPHGEPCVWDGNGVQGCRSIRPLPDWPPGFMKVKVGQTAMGGIEQKALTL